MTSVTGRRKSGRSGKSGNSKASVAGGRDGTRRALLLAALRHFARHGIEGTSINELTRAAAARNKSAIHYHFGDKAGLVDQLVTLIQNWFDAARGPLLDALEARRVAGEPVPLDAVLRALIAPYVALIEGEAWGLDAVRVIARLQFEQDAAGWGVLRRKARVAVRRMADLLGAALGRPLDRDSQRVFAHYIDSTIVSFATYRHLRVSFLGDLSLSPAQLGEFLIANGVRQLSAAAAPRRRARGPAIPRVALRRQARIRDPLGS